MAKEKVVLAYSGGLDTSVIMKWLKENYDYDVIAVCCNAGQKEDFKAIEEKAIATGAIKAMSIDIREEFITDYIWPTLKAGASYENYLLGTAMARPLMAKKLVEIAQEEGAFYIAHGCTGKGNDQVRFEAAIHSLDPAIKIIAPWRMKEWEFESREDMIQYSHDHGIPISQSNAKIYSRDENIWHISHEGGELENPWNVHYDSIHVLSVPPEQAPDEVTYVDIDFEDGIPVAVDGEKLGPIELLTKLNELGSKNGIGTIDIVENRLVGMNYSLCGTRGSRRADSRQGYGSLQEDRRREIRGTALHRALVHTAQGSDLRFCRQDAGERYRNCQDETVQGQRNRRRQEGAVLAVQRRVRYVQ